MPSGIKISSEMEAEILRLRTQGRSCSKISSELGISAGPVRRILNPESHQRHLLGQRAGLTRYQGREVPSEVKAKAFELRSQGKFYREIRLELGLGRKATQRIFDPVARERAKERHRRLKALCVHTTINGIRRQYRVEGRRPKPENCEVCNRKPAKRNGLGWHHWNDNLLEHGLWLCTTCHTMGENIDKERHKRYLMLKDKVLRGEL